MAFKLIDSYLLQCTQKVVLNNKETGTTIESGTTTLKQGVPQGSVLGPLLFALYISPLGDICKQHEINFHLYANDSQNYLGFKTPIEGSQAEMAHQLENCISDICIWMQDNLLKLNDEKMEFLILGTPHQINLINDMSIQVSNTTIQPIESARNLGINLDKWTTYVNKVTSTLYLSLQNIARIHNHLDEDTTKIIIWALILSKLAYGNSTFTGIPHYNITNYRGYRACLAKLCSSYTKGLTSHWLCITFTG